MRAVKKKENKPWATFSCLPDVWGRWQCSRVIRREVSMKRKKSFLVVLSTLALLLFFAGSTGAWYDETHVAIAKVTGYPKWFNACGADMIKVKARSMEMSNHYTNNPPDTVITPDTVFSQIKRYNTNDPTGHLYGAIIASLRDYIQARWDGKYGEYHLAFCAHYVGDLSMPLHNTLYNGFNRKNHATVDGIINDEVLDNLDRIALYPISLDTERSLAEEIARIANISMKLGYQLEAEDRLLTREEAYRQISHSASLFKAILTYSRKVVGE
jgi:hypothetical protein